MKCLFIDHAKKHKCELNTSNRSGIALTHTFQARRRTQERGKKNAHSLRQTKDKKQTIDKYTATQMYCYTEAERNWRPPWRRSSSSTKKSNKDAKQARSIYQGTDGDRGRIIQNSLRDVCITHAHTHTLTPPTSSKAFLRVCPLSSFVVQIPEMKRGWRSTPPPVAHASLNHFRKRRRSPRNSHRL